MVSKLLFISEICRLKAKKSLSALKTRSKTRESVVVLTLTSWHLHIPHRITLTVVHTRVFRNTLVGYDVSQITGGRAHASYRAPVRALVPSVGDYRDAWTLGVCKEHRQ